MLGITRSLERHILTNCRKLIVLAPFQVVNLEATSSRSKNMHEENTYAKTSL